ncbi:unnamed protein product [Vitrella brassicaformis CCMP3155]|uniref:Uncharacterized protein n=1 Tax=Vitrella brassicaformis (strain CCMP3155) TaxID=1169540 RepID=A0A0G4FGY5_VITBC|nr:unnamed protein product [Vitrella brassicaformis CCMP3155]|eukprot:CEM12115.1 unnamed protein product [Vitrella brassicaformis CCMP3155]
MLPSVPPPSTQQSSTRPRPPTAAERALAAELAVRAGRTPPRDPTEEELALFWRVIELGEAFLGEDPNVSQKEVEEAIEDFLYAPNEAGRHCFRAAGIENVRRYRALREKMTRVIKEKGFQSKPDRALSDHEVVEYARQLLDDARSREEGPGNCQCGRSRRAASPRCA